MYWGLLANSSYDPKILLDVSIAREKYRRINIKKVRVECGKPIRFLFNDQRAT